LDNNDITSMVNSGGIESDPVASTLGCDTMNVATVSKNAYVRSVPVSLTRNRESMCNDHPQMFSMSGGCVPWLVQQCDELRRRQRLELAPNQ
jgi:hypothetical protein